MTTTNSKPTIQIVGGIPTYTSPFIEERNTLGSELLSHLRRPRQQLNLSDVWASRLPFPLAGCFNVHTFCNEACVMCPYEDSYQDKSGHKLMHLTDFRQLIAEFAALGGKIVTFNNFSDIFAHKHGMTYVLEVIRNVPEVCLYLVTNGVAMTPDKVDLLIAEGFDGIIYVSCHAFSKETFKVVTKRSAFDVVKSNIDHLVSKHPHPERIVIQYAMDYSAEEEIEQARSYWNAAGVSLNMFQTHTFSGSSSHRVELPKKGRLAGCRGWGSDAGQPFYQIVVQANGDVTLCCHDLLQTVVVGNALTDGIEGVWNSDAFKRLVDDLYLGRSNDDNFICRKCSLAQFADEPGQKSDSIWRSLKQQITSLGSKAR